MAFTYTKCSNLRHVPPWYVAVGLFMFAVTCAEAQPFDVANDVISLRWRGVTLSQGFTRQNYSEPDPLGRVSPLDSETGALPFTEVTLRWREQLSAAGPELVMQANASYAQGQTAYSGYLQQGIALSPYNASTGNILQTLSLRIGLPLNALIQQPWARHIAPYAEQSWNRWQRNLTQYGETFDWSISSLGLMGMWPLPELGLPHLSRFALEADVAVGRTRNPRVSAPALSFAADLGVADVQTVALGLHYAFTPTWSLGLRCTTQRKNFGASASVDGLQFPGASYNSQGCLISVGTQL